MLDLLIKITSKSIDFNQKEIAIISKFRLSPWNQIHIVIIVIVICNSLESEFELSTIRFLTPNGLSLVIALIPQFWNIY